MILCSFRDLLSSCPGGKEYRELLTINRKKRRDEKKKRSKRSQKKVREVRNDSVLIPG
jgi:hypothetical protein